MQNRVGLCVGVLAICAATAAFGQNSPGSTISNPIQLSQTSIQLKQTTVSKVPNAIKSALASGAQLPLSIQRSTNGDFAIPYWQGSFNYGGNPFNYTMVGGAPQRGGTTIIPTQIIPITVVLDGCVDLNNNPVSFNPQNVVSLTLNSPNFEEAAYSSGYTQYGDAQFRAEFYNSMRGSWHTLLGNPQKLSSVTVEVPPGLGYCAAVPGGQAFADVDVNFFASQLETILQLEPVRLSGLPITFSKDVFLYEGGDPGQCCILGFHSAGPLYPGGNPLQTMAWASWVSTADDLGSGWGDVTALSHEISEWMNDPFTANIVPPGRTLTVRAPAEETSWRWVTPSRCCPS